MIPKFYAICNLFYFIFQSLVKNYNVMGGNRGMSDAGGPPPPQMMPRPPPPQPMMIGGPPGAPPPMVPFMRPAAPPPFLMGMPAPPPNYFKDWDVYGGKSSFSAHLYICTMGSCTLIFLCVCPV